MSPSSSGAGPGGEHPFSVTARVMTEIRPYVAIFAILLFWYQQTVSVDTTNNSDSVHSEVTIHLRGTPEMPGCNAFDEIFVIPRLAPHDTETRIFRYRRKLDCPYSFLTEVISYR